MQLSVVNTICMALVFFPYAVSVESCVQTETMSENVLQCGRSVGQTTQLSVSRYVYHLHGCDVLLWGDALVIEAQPLLNLLLHLLSKSICGSFAETVNPAAGTCMSDYCHAQKQ